MYAIFIQYTEQRGVDPVSRYSRAFSRAKNFVNRSKIQIHKK